MNLFRYFRRKKREIISVTEKKADYSNLLQNALIIELILVRASEYYAFILHNMKKDVTSSLFKVGTQSALVTQITSLFGRHQDLRLTILKN